MAIWQFEFLIIPKDRDKIKFKEDDEFISWIGVNISSSAISYLSHALTCEKSWSNDIQQYGNRDSTCIEIFFKEKEIEEIRCRFDLRDLTKSVLVKVLDFITMINGEIFYNGNSYKADLETAVSLMKSSDAAKFCNNPLEYIRGLA